MRRLIEARPAAARILDPFAGSGTTLVESSLAGRAGFGVELNPLGVLLARLKASPWSAADRALLDAAAAEVAARSLDAARAARRAATRPDAPSPRTRYDEPRFYPPHVFRELVSLRGAIDEVAGAIDAPPPVVARVRGALLLVLSSIVVKVSLQRSDTDPTIVVRTIARGAATRHFERRAFELSDRLAAFAARVPPGTPRPNVREGDARRLAHLQDASIDLVVTSPPYLGTYDYVAHHARRFGWLGLDDRRLRREEIGARRRTGDPDEARRAYQRDVHAWLGEAARALVPGGELFALVGDSRTGGAFVPGDEDLLAIAPRVGLELVAAARQPRPAVGPPEHAPARPRHEHLLALRRR